MSGKNFHLVSRGFDVRPLLHKLEARSDLWESGLRETYAGSAHRQSRSIMVRWVPPPDGDDMMASFVAGAIGKPDGLLERVLASTDSIDYPAAAVLMPHIGEAVMSVLEQLGAIGELGHVMLTRLPRGGAIAAHTDEGAYAELYDRFHLCLQGDDGNVFVCGREEFRPAAGDVFWFNHKREHLVRNSGAEDRIHLIVDVMAPDFTRLRGLYFQAERIGHLWPELEPLLEAHWREVAHYQDIGLEPDKDAYAEHEQAGALRCFTARDAGRLVGYAFFFVRPNMHYRGSLQAWQDVLFLHPDYRGRAGVTLIRVAETRLRAEGVQVVYHHAKRTNRVGELLGRLGYELVDEIYAKRLDKNKE